MALLAPGDHVQEADTDAVWPIWRVTVTPRGGSDHEWANVDDAPFDGVLLEMGDVLRQAKASSRGRLRISVNNIDDESTLPAGQAWEGADVTVSVVYGVVDDIIWTGNVDEVIREDQLYLILQAQEGRSWLDLDLLAPVTSADYPEAPAASLDRGRPVVLGNVRNFPPILVEDVAGTFLTETMVTLDTSAEVDSTDGFPSSGSLKIGLESMTYASIGPTTFSGLVRSAPESHIPGDAVVEVGELLYLVADHSLHNVSAMSNLRMETSTGALVPIPADVTVTPSLAGGVATIRLSKQPTVAASIATPALLKFIDLDTAAHTDLSTADAEKCIGLADGFVDVDQSILTADGEGTGGQRVAPIVLPVGAVIERAWAVIEHFDEKEAETTANGQINVGATSAIGVIDTSDFPSSGFLILESGSQNAELISYSAKGAVTFQGLVRGLNSDHQVPAVHPSGSKVSWSSGLVHLDLAGGDADNQNAIGHIETKPPVPEVVSCQFFPSVHEFDSDHEHVIQAHDHGLWDSIHAHKATKGFVVFASAVWIDPGTGGATGSPEVSGVSGALSDGASSGFEGISVGSDISALGLGAYVNANWYALTFPADVFKGDTRQVVGCEAFVMVSGGGSMQVVTDGVPQGPINPGTIPYFGFSGYPLIPPEIAGPLVSPFGTSVIGTSGTWTTNSVWGNGISPASGDDVVLIREPGTPTNSHDAWGGDGGTGAQNKYFSLPGNVRRNFPAEGAVLLPNPLEDSLAGYIRLSLLDSGIHEYVGYFGLEWANFSPARIRLKNIVRGLNLTLSSAWASGGTVRARFLANGCHHLATRHIGTLNPATFPADNAATLAQLSAASPVPSVYQTNMLPIWNAVKASQFYEIPAGTISAPYVLTVADFFNRRTTRGNLSRNPFDVDSSDKTKIHPQFNAMRPEIVARSPVIWVQACEGMTLHSAWLEVVTEEQTTDGEFGDPLPASQGPTDPFDPLGVSTLTWIDITESVSDITDLENATLKVDRNDDLSPPNDLRILRQFFVVELSGTSTTELETPKRLVIDVEGAGVTAPGGTVDGAEIVKQLAVAGLGQVASTVLNEASFTAAGPSTFNGGIAFVDQIRGEKALEELAESFRLVPTWDGDGKLAVSYLPHRLSLPVPVKTFVADDIYWGSVRPTRGKLSDVISNVVVRGKRDYVGGGHEIVGFDDVTNPVVQNHLELDADALITQQAVDDLAGHFVQYGRDVPVRVAFTTFATVGLQTFPGQIIGITSDAWNSDALFVERVTIRPSSDDPGLCHIECRDLTLEAGTVATMGLSFLDGNAAPYNTDNTAASDASSDMQDAIDAAIALGYAGVDFSSGRYRMDTTVNIYGPVLLRFGHGTGAKDANNNGTNQGTTRCEWNGGAGGTMFNFTPEVTASNRYLHGAGMLEVVLAGRFASAGGGVAGIGISSIDTHEFRIFNVRTEFIRVAGIFSGSTNGNTTTRYRIDGFRHIWGTNIANPEVDSFGIIADFNNTDGHSAQARLYDINGLFYDGGLLKMIGSVDNWSIDALHGVRQSGGSGEAWVMVDNSDAAEPHPRNHRVGYMNGRIDQGAGSRGNLVDHYNAEQGAIVAASGGNIHYKALDNAHGDMFETHVYRMTDELRLPMKDWGDGAGTAPLEALFSSLYTSWDMLGSVTRSRVITVQPPYHWSSGTITHVRVLYGVDKTGGAGPWNDWDLSIRMAAKQEGVSFASTDYDATTAVDITSALANRIYSVDIAVSVSYVRGDIVAINLRRIGGADDSTGSIYFMGAKLIYEGTGPDNGVSGPFAITPPFVI